jgi:hypothetical protein
VWFYVFFDGTRKERRVNDMGLVTDIFWNCPGCGSREQAQTYGDWGDPSEFPLHRVPASRGLKWNPPCSKCGNFKLVMPETYVACSVIAVEEPVKE